MDWSRPRRWFATESSFDLCATEAHIFRMQGTIIQPPAQKRERLVARVSSEDKAIISQAAAIAGQSVGSFMLAEARKAALKTLETHQRIVLNAEQSRSLVEAHLGPPRQPTKRMIAAMRAYKATVKSDLD